MPELVQTLGRERPPDVARRPFPRPCDWALLGGALLVLFTVCLGTRGLNEPDEGRYGAVAFAMAAPGGDWWEPRMSGWGHYDKPPLIYWATAASFRLFGVHEWTARLPSLAGAALTLAGLGWAAGRLRGPRVAWWAVLVCGTSLQFWLLGRVLSPDMLLCGWCTLAVAAWAECRRRGGAWGFWLLSLLCWTLAWWTKATCALIPLAGLAVGISVARDQAGRRALRLPWLLPLLVALGSPWYVSMLWRYPDLRAFFFVRELAGRVAGNVNGRHGSPIYYLPVSLAGWLPWWPVAVWRWSRGRMRFPTGGWSVVARHWSGRLGEEGWIVAVGLIVFSAISSKLPTYTLPLMPWAALTMARVISRRAEPVADRPPVRLLLPAGGFAVVAVAGLLLSPRYETRLGINSSLRNVCRFLASHGARRVDLDHYWPSTEIYLPGTAVYYTVRDDAATLRKEAARGFGKPHEQRFHERPSDPGKPPNRFSEITPWPALPADDPQAAALADGEIWFVRFVPQKDSPFNAFINRAPADHPPELMLRDGDFRVYRTVLAHGRLPGERADPPPSP